MTPTRVAAVEVRPVRWPLRVPFVTALGRKAHTDNALVRVALSGGAVGRGEASSSLAMAFQTGPLLAAALRRLGRRFIGADVRDLPNLSAQVWRAEGRWPTAAAAFEVALWDALARSEGAPLARFWGGAREGIETLLTVSAVSPAEVGRRSARAARTGYRFLKLKLNGREGIALNRERLRAAARGAPRARFLLDPNQSFTPDLLEDLLDAAARDGVPVEAAEEPFPKKRWSVYRRRAYSVPLLLDESVQGPSDVGPAVRVPGVRGVNVKFAKSGVVRSREIVRRARAAWGARAALMIGCMAESRVGLAAAVHFALGTGAFRYADLDSDLLLLPTPDRGGYRRDGPWIRLPKRPRPGLGL